jgi:hypothetical protein
MWRPRTPYVGGTAFIRHVDYFRPGRRSALAAEGHYHDDGNVISTFASGAAKTLSVVFDRGLLTAGG